MKSKNTAGWLSLLLGGLGVHRFYLGQNMLGFVYILICWSGISLIVSIVDAIIFWTMDKRTFDKKYNLTPITNINAADEIEKLHSLWQKGIITDEEYSDRKQRLIR